MKLKKIPYYFFLFLLIIGASAIIGFLSFTGMFTIAPFIGLAIGAFILSVAYEGEIYLQNIKGALNKLFKRDFLKNQLANDSLLRLFKNDAVNTKAADCPQFFKDYEAQLQLLHKFSHKRLDEKSQRAKRQIEKTLKDMERWYAVQLFAADPYKPGLTHYERSLRFWLEQRRVDVRAKALFADRSTTYKWVMGFSAVSGLFMSIGITYLLVEAFSILPILAAISLTTLPAIIVPMALICGAAYTFLIYNAVTDMIHNNTLGKWYYKIRDDLRKGITPRSVFIAVSAVALLALTVALTVCTAGTWWTVAKNARPLFSWMSKMPSFIMGIINPLILGASQLIFNLQNTSESLEMIDNATRMKEGFFTKIAKGIADAYHHMMDNENWLQILNPFRFILKLTVTPLRLILFFGHLISIGVTADRVPGIPEIASAILGIISEGFEDAHYFIGDLLHSHDHHHHKTKDLLKERFGEGHGHDHSADIPSRLLTLIFLPLYALAAIWDYGASRHNKTAEPCGLMRVDGEAEPSFAQLRERLQGQNAVILHNDQLYYVSQRKEKVKAIKQTAENQASYEDLKAKCADEHRFAKADELEAISPLTQTKRHSVNTALDLEEAWDRQIGRPPKQSVEIKPTAVRPSQDWQLEQSVHRIDNYLQKHLSGAKINKQTAKEKARGLVQLRRDLKNMHGADEAMISTRITEEAQKPVYGQHRFFNVGNKTRTEEFLTQLPERISASPAA